MCGITTVRIKQCADLPPHRRFIAGERIRQSGINPMDIANLKTRISHFLHFNNYFFGLKINVILTRIAL